jgi:hypothetical protein
VQEKGFDSILAAICGHLLKDISCPKGLWPIDVDTEIGGNVRKAQMMVVTLLALSVVACFLPWMTANVETEDQNISTTNSGYEYIVPLGAKYTAPVAILSVIGFVLIAYSFMAIDKARMLIVLGSILVLVGAVAAYIYTSSAAMSDTSGSLSYSVLVEGRYGLGLEVLFGILTLVVGVRTESESSSSFDGPVAGICIRDD